MGYSEPAYKRLWLPFTAGAVLVAAAVVIGLWMLPRGGDQPAGPGAPVKVPHTSVPQAKWKVKTYPAGDLGKSGKKVYNTVARERPRLTRVVTDVYDALFLVPDRYRQVVTGYFDKPGAGILLHSSLAPPKDAKDVSTKVRRASIGVQANTAARAAARVKVKAKAKDNGHPIIWTTTSTLWLEKEKGRWRVVGFAVDQAPVAGKSQKGTDKKSHQGPARHRDKKHRGKG